MKSLTSICGRIGVIAAFVLSACASSVDGAHGGSAVYDVVVRHGRVIDGGGNPWVHADIAIRDGRIVRVGVVTETGATEIDARGRYVSPGWIDAMDQSGEVLLTNGLAENKLLMGVTTAVGGESGAPVSAAELDDYFSRLERQGISLNFGTYYGATQARVEVIGDVAGPATDEEIARMRAIVREAMQQGAMGLTTALIYPPATFQTTDELVALAEEMRPFGGFYATHMRDEGANLIASIEEAVEIGERAGVGVEIFHLKAAYAPGWGRLMAEAGAVIDGARGRGVDVAANMYPYTAGGTGLDVTIPPEVLRNGRDAALENLRNPEFRRALLQRIHARDFGDWSRLNLIESAGGWRNVVLANAQSAEFSRFNGRNMEEIAEALGEDPWEVSWRLVVEAAPERAFAFFFLMSEEDVRTALRFPWTSIGSDAAASERLGEVDALGLPHPRAYGTFPRVIAEYVREQHVLGLEDAVRKMTSWPASRLGMFDRGVIREGLWADLVVFDFDTIQDEATWRDGMRPPSGIDYVLVNGVVVVDHGVHTGARPGRVIRGRGAAGVGTAP